MKIEIDGALIGDALKTMRNLIGGATTFLEVVPNFLKMTSSNNGNAFMTTVPIKVKEKSKVKTCALDSQALIAALNRVKNVELEFGESSLTIRSGRYTAEIITHQFENTPVIPESEKEKGMTIKSKFLANIAELLPKLELQPLLTTYDFVPFGVKVTKEGAFLASYDFYQAAFVSTDLVKGNFEFVMPNNIFSVLAKEIKGQDYQLVITDNTIYAYNETFEYAAAIPQSEGNEGSLSFDEMQKLHKSIKSLIKESGVTLKLKTDAINQMIENGKSIYEKDSTFTFTVKGDKCKLDLKSSSGKISTVIMLEEKAKDISFSCDFNFFSTLMKKAGQSIKLVVIPDQMLLFTNKPIVYMMSLS